MKLYKNIEGTEEMEQSSTPVFEQEDDKVDFRQSVYGYTGPIMRYHGPAAFYVASLVVMFTDRPGDMLCIDGNGQNFNVDHPVWARREDVKAEVETWKPGYWLSVEHLYGKYQMNPDDLKPLLWKRMGYEEHEDVPKEFKVVVTGQTEFFHAEPIERVFRDLRSLLGNGISIKIIHGAAPGADTVAAAAAKRLFGEDNVLAFPANWSLLGLKAGPLRNSVMIAQGPQLVIAFYVKEGPLFSKGTNDTVKKAGQKQIPVLKYEHDVGWM